MNTLLLIGIFVCIALPVAAEISKIHREACASEERQERWRLKVRCARLAAQMEGGRIR